MNRCRRPYVLNKSVINHKTFSTNTFHIFRNPLIYITLIEFKILNYNVMKMNWMKRMSLGIMNSDNEKSHAVIRIISFILIRLHNFFDSMWGRLLLACFICDHPYQWSSLVLKPEPRPEVFMLGLGLTYWWNDSFICLHFVCSGLQVDIHRASTNQVPCFW